MNMPIAYSIQTFKNLTYPVRDVSGQTLMKEGKNLGIWNFGESIDKTTDLIVGFSPTNYHTFIICRDTEYHPRFAFNPPRIGKSRRRAIRAGAFLRIRGLTEGEMLFLEYHLKNLKSKRTPSCHVGAFQALNSGIGLSIKGVQSPEKLSPHQFLYFALTNGLCTPSEESLKVDFFTTRSKSLSTMFNEMLHFERKFRWFYILSDFYYALLKFFNPKSIIRL